MQTDAGILGTRAAAEAGGSEAAGRCSPSPALVCRAAPAVDGGY